MKPCGRLAGRSILVLAVVAALGVGWVTWGGPVKRRLAEWMKSDASRVADAAAAYEAARLGASGGTDSPVAERSKPTIPRHFGSYARASARMEHDTTAAAIYAGRLGTSLLATRRLFPARSLERPGRPVRERARGLGQSRRARRRRSRAARQPGAGCRRRCKRLDEAADAARRLSRKPGWEVRGLLLLGEILAMLDDPKGQRRRASRGLRARPQRQGRSVAAVALSRSGSLAACCSLASRRRRAQALEAIRATGGWRRRSTRKRNGS